MKISELILKLEAEKKEHGDIEVNVFSSESLISGCLETTEIYLSHEVDEQNNVKCVTVSDFETIDAFSG